MKRLSTREILTLLIATIVLLIALYTAVFNNQELIKTKFFNKSVGASPIEIITDMITELKEASVESIAAANIA